MRHSVVTWSFVPCLIATVIASPPLAFAFSTTFYAWQLFMAWFIGFAPALQVSGLIGLLRYLLVYWFIGKWVCRVELRDMCVGFGVRPLCDYICRLT